MARLKPEVLDDAAAASLDVAPLAQKPTLTTKKCVYMMDDGAYKGPYMVDRRADVVRVVRTLYREHVMRNVWGDEIVAHHEPVFDPRTRALYLRMALVGDRGPDKWETTQCKVKRGGAEQDVDVVNRDSHGLVVINTMEWLGSENFVGAFARIVIHMAARYLVGGGDANLNNVIGCPKRGHTSVTAVDIEDNRDCSKKKKKKPAVAPKAPANDDDGGEDEEKTNGDTTAAAAAAPQSKGGALRPTLMRCLFAPGRGPKADEQPTFDDLLRRHMGAVRDFTDRVRASLGNEDGGGPDAGIKGAVEYAREIGYTDAKGTEVPTRAQVATRLDVLEACLDEFDGVVMDGEYYDDEEDGGDGDGDGKDAAPVGRAHVRG